MDRGNHSCCLVSSSRSILILVVVLGALVSLVGAVDLYRVLGVSRSAGTKEIRTAYKRLAKHWHPDKNKSPEAQEKIMELNKAYEILADEEKRRRYDLTGDTGESPQGSRGHRPGEAWSMPIFRSGSSFQFRFFTGSSWQRQDLVTTNHFFDTILPGSHEKPYLLNFFHDLCLQCGDLEPIWEELRRELEPYGVGLGSVHGNMHPRVTNYCGVIRVPAVVGVVSGRVVHYYRQGALSTGGLRGFLENILPKVVTELTSSSISYFLSEVIERNHPRVILFSPRKEPSLLFRVVALANHRQVDFAYVANYENGPLPKRFGIKPGEKQLLVFREYQQPEVVLEGGDLSSSTLQALAEGVRLHLPRLSGPRALDLICPMDGTNRFCVVLVVPGIGAYNDSITNDFRAFAREGTTVHHWTVSFAYIDAERQAEFLKAVSSRSVDLKQCSSGELARSVVVLQRYSNQQVLYNWFAEFCGRDDGVGALQRFLSSVQLRNSAVLPNLKDEAAPGFLRHMWNKVVQTGYDISDFISAVDPHIFTPLTGVLVMALLLCLSGIIGQGPQETSKQLKPSRHRGAVIHPMDRERYDDIIHNSPRGLVTIVLLVNSHKRDKMKEVTNAFWTAFQGYMNLRINVCYLCYKTNKRWFGDILSHCCGMDPKEADARLSACYNGRVATVLCMLGAKKQLCIFQESVSACNGVTTTREAVEKSSRKERTVNGVGVMQQSVGKVLGDALGFEQEDSHSQAVGSGDNEHLRQGHTHQNSAKTETNSVPESEVKAAGSDSSSEASEVGSLGNAGDEEGERCQGMSRSGSQADSLRALSRRLEVWLERLADGSLKRYEVDMWPDWQ